MATRTAVTYEQVAAIANGLYAAGNKNPGAKLVRQHLAEQRGPGATVGSLGTIQRHLDHWREHERPRDPQAPVPQLPAAVGEALAAWVNKSTLDAQTPLQLEADRLHSELLEAAGENETMEAQIEQLGQDLASRTSERDAVRGELATRTSEIADLKAQLTTAQERLATVERELSTAQANEKAAVGRVDEIRAASDRRTSELQAEIEALRKQLATATQERNAASEAAAVAKASLTGESRRADQAEAREATLQADIKSVREQLAESQRTASKAAAELAAATAGEATRKQQVKDLQTVIDMATAGQKAAKQEAADRAQEAADLRQRVAELEKQLLGTGKKA